MIGSTFELLRDNKNMKLKEVAAGIMATSQLSKIERDEHRPSLDNFIYLLNRLNVTYDEFFELTEDEYYRHRQQLKPLISETLRRKNPREMKKLLKTLTRYEGVYQDDYFTHMKAIVKAAFITQTLSEVDLNKDFLIRQALSPVISYLEKVNQWHFYELSLLNHSLYFYEYSTALKLGEEALKSIKKRYAEVYQNQYTRSLLNNLALLSLNQGDLIKAYDFISMALAMPTDTKYLYENFFSRVVHQVICYRLKNGMYQDGEIPFILDVFSFMGLEDISQMLLEFAIQHSLPLDSARRA